jgi:hypothetical protein
VRHLSSATHFRHQVNIHSWPFLNNIPNAGFFFFHLTCVAYPQHFFADPDPSFHCDVDPDPDPSFHIDVDTDPFFYFDTDPDLVPDKSDANLRPMVLKLSSARI